MCFANGKARAAHGIRIHFDALPAIKFFDGVMPLRPGTDLKYFKNLSQIHKNT
jgi:hypothetical protein